MKTCRLRWCCANNWCFKQTTIPCEFAPKRWCSVSHVLPCHQLLLGRLLLTSRRHTTKWAFEKQADYLNRKTEFLSSAASSFFVCVWRFVAKNEILSDFCLNDWNYFAARTMFTGFCLKRSLHIVSSTWLLTIWPDDRRRAVANGIRDDVKRVVQTNRTILFDKYALSLSICIYFPQFQDSMFEASRRVPFATSNIRLNTTQGDPKANHFIWKMKMNIK